MFFLVQRLIFYFFDVFVKHSISLADFIVLNQFSALMFVKSAQGVKIIANPLY